MPDACVAELERANLIVHAGDFVALSVLEELRSLAPVEAVYGNMDEPALRESLPKERVVEVAGARIGVVHIPGPAAGREARLVSRFPGCGAVVYGHTHIPQVGIYGADAEVATRLAPTPYHRLTDVFGGHAEHVERPNELAPALERALAAGKPAIVNVTLDPDAMAGHPYRGM